MAHNYTRRLFAHPEYMDEQTEYDAAFNGLELFNNFLVAFPDDLNVTSLFIEQIYYLLRADIVYHHYKDCIEHFQDYYLNTPHCNITSSRFHVACTCLAGCALGQTNAEESVILDTFKRAFQYWKFLLRSEVEIEEKYYLKDILEYLIRYDKEGDTNLYAGMYYILFHEEEDINEMVACYHYVAMKFFDSSEFEVASYYYKSALKYMESHHFDDKELVKDTYLHIAEGYEFSGNPEKAEYYYQLVNTFDTKK